MKTENRQFDRQRGSALILVVVVTVLLAVVGVMFLMVSRAAELETGAVVQNKDLDAAVESVVARINDVLVEDLFVGSGFDPNAHDATADDPWLCDLEPNFVPDVRWSHITDLWNRLPDTLVLDNLSGTPTWTSQNPAVGLRADADGDGVADSGWSLVPNLTTSRGEPVFAAVRIIDNCAMLNLNAANNFYANAGGVWHTDAWKYTETGSQYNPTGHYLSEVNYRFFLRGLDRDIANVKAIDYAKDPVPNLFTPKAFHDLLIMNIENPPALLTPFDISDELEIRNRYLLTGLPIAKFEREDVAYETFDRGRGQFGGGWDTAIRVKRIPIQNDVDFTKWKTRLDSFNSNDMSGNENDDYYDRRHLCTFYSFDRPLGKGKYPLLDLVIGNFAIANWAADGFTSAAEYKEHLWDLWGPVFVPKGTATTNIETPSAVDASGSSVPYNNVETRRKILHLLYAFRAYYLEQGDALDVAAKKSAQIVANIIDFSDGNFGIDPILEDDPKDYGPFYEPSFTITDNGGANYSIDYKQQVNLDCTFLTQEIIDAMILEVSHALSNGDVVLDPAFFDFGLGSEIVFGYERQPFISEVYAEWDGDQPNPLLVFAVELVNPYPDPIDLTGYSLKIASQATPYPLDGQEVPGYDLINKHGRLVIRRGTVTSTGGNVTFFDVAFPTVLTQGNDNTISLLRSNPSDSGSVDIVVDQVLDSDYDDPNDPSGTIFQDPAGGGASKWSAARDDTQWKFTQPVYQITENPTTIGDSKEFDPNELGVQLACPSDGYSVSRLHDLETLSLYGNGIDQNDPNVSLGKQLLDAGVDSRYFDLDLNSLVYTEGLTDYIAVMNRPDKGSLPGRINVNTAPVHVIAAAIPPTLASIKSSGYNAFTMAQQIVENRPYTHIAELLNLDSFDHLDSDDENIGYTSANGGDDQAIVDDIEERDWILSHLANKFTVRSDVFTAYILVRLGTDGPQRRMIGIFDRSQVWDKNDRPKLVALHPVPDPR